jgi:cobalt-zinc-cadmium resistance protein CzcA
VLLLAFLGNLRAAAVVAAILPLAALGTFILMYSAGLSANLMSLGGLAIAIGMLVDAAVVVVENVEAKLTEPASQRLPFLHVIYRAAREVAVPVASGIAIIIIVFLPLLTLQGLEGKLFIPVALAIVFALGSSLLLAFTIVPVLASFALHLPAAGAAHHEPWLVRKVNAWYAPRLELALANGRRVTYIALGLLVAAGVAYGFLGKTFMPVMDEGDLIMQVQKLPSVSLDQTMALDTRIQQAVMAKVPEIKGIVARSGADELGLDPMGLNETDTFLVLKPMAEWRQPDKDWLTDQVREAMADFPGVALSFTQPIDMRVSEMLTGVRGDLAIKLYGSDLPQLNALAQQIASTVRGVTGAEDVLTVRNEGVQYLRVVIDRLAAGRLGMAADELENNLRALVEGQPTGLVVESNRRTPIIIRGSGDLRASYERFADLRFALPNGQTVPLSALAKLERVDGPVKVEREAGSRYVVVQANVRGRDLVGFVEEAKAAVASKVKLPTGYRLAWGGQFENQQRAAARLSVVVPVAILLIFLLLFSTFGSARQAGLVLANVPFALVGGVFALLLAGEYLSVPASVGFIALLGVAVLNGVVMVTYFNQLLDRGMPVERVVVEGAKRRLRPVLMTAGIAAFGLVPLLFASGPGSEIQRPLAVVVIGGLITSTALTLFLLPVLFRRFGVPPKSSFRDSPAR